MSERIIGNEYDPDVLPNSAQLVAGIRVDRLPANEALRLASDGEFYPLTTDADGNLRVALPVAAKVETAELEVLREMRGFLEEIRDLLVKIA